MLTLSLFRTELVKQFRRTRTYVAYGIVMLIPVIMTIALDLNPPDPSRGDRGGLLFAAARSGLVVPAAALRFTSAFLLVIVVALFGGDAIAGEASWGNLRYMLMRPIGRTRLVLTKLAVAIVYAWLAVLLVIVAGLIAGGMAFGWHAITLPFGLSQSAGEILGHVGFATVYVAWSLTGVVAFSFMVSCMTDAPGRDLRRGRALLHVADPRLDRAARQHPQHHADPQLRRLGRCGVARRLEFRPVERRGLDARLRAAVLPHRALVVPPQGHPELNPRAELRPAQPSSGSSWSSARASA